MRLLRRWRDRRAEAKRRDALAGRASSGHATQGDRDRMFRGRRKP